MIAQGAKDAKATAKDGTPAAHLAAANGDARTLAVLIERGARVYQLPPAVVHRLIGEGAIDVLAIVFRDGYDFHQVHEGLNAADYAASLGKTEIVALIREHGGP